MKIRKFAALISLAAFSFWSMQCSRQRAASTNAALHDSTAATDSASKASLELSTTYEQRQGKILFTKYCAVCHGEEGKGDGFNSYNLDPKPRDFTDEKLMSNLTDERIAQTISGGGRSVNRSALMPSWGGRMSKEEIRYLVAYVRAFNSQKKTSEAK